MIALFTLLLLAQTSDPTAELRQARAVAEAGDPESGAVLLNGLVARYPTWGLAQIELAQALLSAQGPLAPGLGPALEAARTLQPENPRAWSLSGQQLEGLGDLDGAASALRRALALRPDRLVDRERLARLLLQAERWSDAAAELEQVLASDPSHRTARAGLAEAREQLGALGEAERHLRALVEAAPQSAVYRKRLIRFYERNANPEAALREVKRLDAANPPARKLRELPPSRR